MQVEIPLGQPARFSLVALASVLSLVLAYLAITGFIVGSLTSPTLSLSRGEIETAARYYPKSHEIQALLAYSELADDRDYQVAANRAEAAGIRAAQLSPNQFEYRLIVASAREMKGDRAGAEAALREALALGPNRVETHWRLGNNLVRQNKLEEATSYLRRAVGARPGLLPQTLKLIWDLSGGKVDKMEAMVGENPNARRDLAFFLIEQGYMSDGVRVFNLISRADRLKSDESGAFVSGLISTGQIELARRIWGDMVTENAAELTPVIFNGGFERMPQAALDQFDWNLSDNDHVQVGISKGAAHSGERALRLEFRGVNTTRVDGQILQFLLVKPGTRYRLSCFVKTNGFHSPFGPQLVITKADRVAEIAKSEPISSGSDDWRQLTLDFEVPVSVATILVEVKRIPRFSYDEPTKGTIWLDDFELKEIGSAK